MIFKIIMEFNNIGEIIDNLSKDYDIFLYDGRLYIASINYKISSIKKIKEKIKKDNIYIEEINENNLKNESEYVKNWCLKYFVKNDLQKYEYEEQEELKRIMKQIDIFEDELKKIEKERGV